MTPLSRRLVARIAADGPLTIADYMATCLMDPVHGYYATRDPFGAAGDFVTAPEISQMFGEMIGLALAQIWLDQGSHPLMLVEAGPGRGTLMADILRSTARVPGFQDAVQVHLIETSPVLRDRQRHEPVDVVDRDVDAAPQRNHARVARRHHELCDPVIGLQAQRECMLASAGADHEDPASGPRVTVGHVSAARASARDPVRPRPT